MILAQLGALVLLAALALSLFSAGALLRSAMTGSAKGNVAGRWSFYFAAYLVLLASVAFEAALLGHDFAIAAVAQHSSRSMPWPLLAAAFYGGQEGSLLYWALVLASLGSLALSRAARTEPRLAAFAGGVLAVILGFLLVILNFVSSPFSLLTVTPPDGAGLNPLLRDDGMLVHPPFLLAGFSSFAIPFSFAIAALLAGRSDPGWIRLTRGFALLAWALQGTGLLLGMWWAYHVLGWGGYWGWDPVENVALLPWLATTAYLHSAQIQERRGMLKVWNFCLVILAFCLSVLGTFLVRSGVIQSVHTFAVSAIGPWFFGFLLATVVFAGLTLALRSPLLRADRVMESPVSREGAFLLNNLLFLGLLLAVLWGTLLPLFSGLLQGGQQVVGATFYERAAGPLFLSLLALLALGPLLPWSRAGSRVVGTLPVHLTVALAVAAALLGAGVRELPPLLAFPILAAVATTSLLEYWRGGRLARRLAGPWPIAALRVAGRHRRRYGAHLAHLGVAVLAAGIAGSHFWQQEAQAQLRPGQALTVGSYQLVYEGAERRALPDATEYTARLRLQGELITPRRLWYPTLQQSATKVAIRTTPVADLYVVLSNVADDGSATFTIFVNPMVGWIWTGGALLILGVLLGNLEVGALGAAAPEPSAGGLRAPLPEPEPSGRSREGAALFGRSSSNNR